MWGKIRRRLSGTATLTALLIAAMLVLAWLAPASDPPTQGAAAPGRQVISGRVSRADARRCCAGDGRSWRACQVIC